MIAKHFHLDQTDQPTNHFPPWRHIVNLAKKNCCKLRILLHIDTTALICVSENGKNDQNRAKMILLSQTQCFPLFSVLYIFYMSG